MWKKRRNSLRFRVPVCSCVGRMTNEEMDRAIAEYLGYRVVSSLEYGLFWLETPEGKQSGYKQGISENHAWAVCCPKYSTDLNAMHQVEKAFMSSGNANEYLKTLDNLVNSGIFCSEYNTVTASAFWRAQAFLRTIGKYSDATHPLP